MSAGTERTHVEKVIERQIRQWELRRKLAEEGGASAVAGLAHLSEGPYVTCSKQLGCGGTLVARKLAERLNWQIFDREILEAIARETHTRDKILSSLDERDVGTFTDYVAHLFVPDHLARTAFIHEMMKVIWAIGRQGHAILVGRGANWILDPRFGLRIRVIADMPRRIRRVMENEGVDAESASRRIKDDDAARVAFIRKVYRREIDDPLGYDVVVNTGTLDIDLAVEVTLTALRRKLEAAPTPA